MTNLNDLLLPDNPFVSNADGSPEGPTYPQSQTKHTYTTKQVAYQAAASYIAVVAFKELRSVCLQLLPPQATVEEVDFYVNHFRSDLANAWTRHYPQEDK